MTKPVISKTSLEDLLEDLNESPKRALQRCRDAFQTSAKAHHEAVHEMIAFIVAFVLHLEGSAEARAEFLADAHWDGKPQRPKEKNLARLAAMYMVGAKASYGALYQQALQYAKVAKHFIEVDIEPEAIPASLRRRPIYSVLDKLEPQQEVDDKADDSSVGYPREQPKTTPRGATTHSGREHDKRDPLGHDDDSDEAEERDGENDHGDDPLGDDDGDLSGDTEDDNDNDAEEPGGDDNRSAGSDGVSGRDRTTSIGGSGTMKTKRYPFKQDRELAVEAEVGWKLFFDRMKPHDEAPVMIRRLPDEDGWAKFEISDLLSRRDYRITGTDG